MPAPEMLPGAMLLAWRRQLLDQGGCSSDFDWLLDLAGGVPWSVLQRLRLDPSTSIQLKRGLPELEAIWRRHRQTAEPLQYLVGLCPWRDLELQVAPGVLIPRQETELLVDLALTSLPLAGPTNQPLDRLAPGQASPATLAAATAKATGPALTASPGLTGAQGMAAEPAIPMATERAGDGDLGASVAPGRRDRATAAAEQAGSGWFWADLGTGSGCMALALARALPGARGLALDQSPQALAQAAENLARHGMEARVRLVQGDWWGGLEPWWGQIHLVVANPPYIPSALIDDLDPVVRDHEPRLALDGGLDGLEAIRAIAAGATRALAPGGVLLLEHHHDQSAAVLDLLARAGLVMASAHPDLEGTLRFARAYRRSSDG